VDVVMGSRSILKMAKAKNVGKIVGKIEFFADLFLKFNLLAIPMYAAIVAGMSIYPMQSVIAEVVYNIIRAAGYWAQMSGVTILLFAPTAPPGPPAVQTLTIVSSFTAWESIYAFAALVIVTPVAGIIKKAKVILAGSVVLLALNVTKVVATIAAAYDVGFSYLAVTDTLVWKGYLIFISVALWLIWFRKQKNNISQSQTIFRAVSPSALKIGLNMSNVKRTGRKRARRGVHRGKSRLKRSLRVKR
jgi:hypothetical protein